MSCKYQDTTVSQSETTSKSNASNRTCFQDRVSGIGVVGDGEYQNIWTGRISTRLDAIHSQEVFPTILKTWHVRHGSDRQILNFLVRVTSGAPLFSTLVPTTSINSFRLRHLECKEQSILHCEHLLAVDQFWSNQGSFCYLDGFRVHIGCVKAEQVTCYFLSAVTDHLQGGPSRKGLPMMINL